MTLGVLDPHAAARLLVAKAARPGLSESDPAVREVVRLCAGLPLALQLMAARLRHYPARQVADLVAELAPADRRLAALTAEDISVAEAFDLSYRALTPEGQAMYRLVGRAAPDTVDRCSAAAWQSLRDLEERHLIEEPMPGRYRMHDLIREHARALAVADDPADRAADPHRLLDR
jgi:hypothetical protein